ncbi:sn-glycerol-3-phosphate ABC transporter ATP-binding protein UgpC [Jiella sp. MQZ9-1]|nr:sn-glycerol-3-phosphate ABC transporter ATP-binding protein UgpC [Jiella flava]MCD2471688.1 sn-glycerol-3-phosphate ABC transporter ATP-binding protein UgpC [Jiella flava]
MSTHEHAAASAISLKGVSKSYGSSEVIRDLSLDFAAGAFTVVLGPSGCGKSTLLRMIAGLESLGSGSVSIGGTPVEKLPPKDRGVAMVFQNYALYPHMTVLQNIGYGLKLKGVPRPERETMVRETAASLGLADLLARKPAELSGGQRQRVAIGRAIVRKPRVLLFDEPLSNLDAQLRTDMRLEISRLHRAIGATSVFVTHDQVEAMTLADRIVVMNQGRIEQSGTPEEIYHNPQTTFVAKFIGSPPMNLLEANVSNGVVCLGEASLLEAPCPNGSITLGVQPTALRLGSGSHTGAVSGIERLGREVVYHLETEHGRISAVAPEAKAGWNPGDAIRFDINTESLALFDPSGQRIAFPPT